MAISWSGVCQKFAKILLMLQHLTKNWHLGGMLRQHHGLEFAKGLPKFSSRCTFDQQLQLGDILWQYHGLEFVKSLQRSSWCCSV